MRIAHLATAAVVAVMALTPQWTVAQQVKPAPGAAPAPALPLRASARRRRYRWRPPIGRTERFQTTKLVITRESG